MKRLEKQNILNQFNLNEIINHFQNGIDSIENQFNIADYLTSNNKIEEAQNIYRSQIVFLESILDFYMHELVKYVLFQIFTNKWDRTEKYLNIEIPINHLNKHFNNLTDNKWFFDFITEKWSREVIQSFEVIKYNLNLIGIPWDDIYKNLKRNNFDLKEFLKDLYKRRNKIAHQNDRDHENAIKQDISKDFVLEKITYLKTFVN